MRLEVALVDGKTMFAWPNPSKLEDPQIRDLVTSGMFGTGSFAFFRISRRRREIR